MYTSRLSIIFGGSHQSNKEIAIKTMKDGKHNHNKHLNKSLTLTKGLGKEPGLHSNSEQLQHKKPNQYYFKKHYYLKEGQIKTSNIAYLFIHPK